MASFAVVRRTSATSSVGTSWAAHVTDGTFDVTVTAAAGDVVEVGVNAVWGVAASYCYGDFATMVSGSPVNWVSTGGSSHTNGILALFQEDTNDNMTMAGSAYYTVQSGDVVSGQVTFRLYSKLASGTRALEVNSNGPAQVWAAVSSPAHQTATLSGTLTTTWTLLTGSCTISAAAGDIVGITLSVVANPASGIGLFDAATVVSGTATRWASSGTTTRAAGGVSAWRCDLLDYEPAGGTVLYTVQSGDVVSGQVTFRIDAAASTSTRTLDSVSSFSVRKVA